MRLHFKNNTRFLVLLVTVSVLGAHRLPAPIVEESPSPTPKAQTELKPRAKPKSTEQPGESSKVVAKEQTSSKHNRFAGTWSGTMNITVFGNIGYTFLIDQTQTTVKMWGTNKPAEIPHMKFDLCPASIGPDGISWNWSAWKWTLQPYPDGKTAFVKVEGPFQSGSAVFTRER